METLAAFSSPESKRKTEYFSGDKVKIKDSQGERIGQLNYNGWSIYELNGTNKIMDINTTELDLKKLTMTLDENSSQPIHDSSRGGKRSRRKSRRSNKSRKSRR